jgi:hypothetical protein
MRRAAAQPVTPRARDAQPGGVGLTGVSTGGGARRGKPFQYAELIRAVETLLAEREAQAQPAPERRAA